MHESFEIVPKERGRILVIILCALPARFRLRSPAPALSINLPSAAFRALRRSAQAFAICEAVLIAWPAI
jgi:hypothetical protein